MSSWAVLEKLLGGVGSFVLAWIRNSRRPPKIDIVPDQDRLFLAWEPARDDGLPLVRISTRLSVTNRSFNTNIRFLYGYLKKDKSRGVVAPYLPFNTLPSTEYELTHDIEPGKTEEVECRIWIRPEQDEGEGFVQPKVIKADIVLVDQFNRKHPLPRLEFRNWVSP